MLSLPGEGRGAGALVIWPGWGPAFLEANLLSTAARAVLPRADPSLLSLSTLKVEEVACTVRQDCFVLSDNSSRQSPSSLWSVAIAWVEGPDVRQERPRSLSMVLCVCRLWLWFGQAHPPTRGFLFDSWH